MSGGSERASYFATCARGLEDLLEGELRALRVAHIDRQSGGVAFEGTRSDAWRVNLESRVAIRVLLHVTRFPAATADELREGVAGVDWSRFVAPEGSLAVRAHARDSALDHTLFVAQCAKDGICDRLRADSGQRPDVDKDDPDLRVVVHLARDRARILVDTSGESLHKRGWRRYQGRAPLAETLAAALILRSGWDRRAPLLDPFCGSGTIPIEAALLAAGTAPGLFRSEFGFERLPGHDAQQFAACKRELRGRSAFPRKLTLWGADSDPRHSEGARENLAAAGLDGCVTFETADALDFAPRPGWNAQIVSNLPYGERVGDSEQVERLLRAFGALLRERCGGYRAALLCGSARQASALGLPAGERIAFENGGLACEIALSEL